MDKSAYTVTDHASQEALRRGIPLEVLNSVIESPDQIVDTYQNRKVYQSRVNINGKRYLVRAIVESSAPLIVITVYRTSKIDKYWSEPL